MRVAILAISIAAASAVTCDKRFVNLDGQCILLAEYKKVCAKQADCVSYFSGQPQCVTTSSPPSPGPTPAPVQNCGWSFGAAAAYCKSFNKGNGNNYGLVKIYNQYQK